MFTGKITIVSCVSIFFFFPFIFLTGMTVVFLLYIFHFAVLHVFFKILFHLVQTVGFASNQLYHQTLGRTSHWLHTKRQTNNSTKLPKVGTYLHVYYYIFYFAVVHIFFIIYACLILFFGFCVWIFSN